MDKDSDSSFYYLNKARELFQKETIVSDSEKAL